MGLLLCDSCSSRSATTHSPGARSPLEDLATALVHLKAAAAEGLVQKGHTVHLDAPGHVEDPVEGNSLEAWPSRPALPERGLENQAGRVLSLLEQHSPATQAFIRDTKAPVISARSTIWEKSLLRWGTREASEDMRA